MGSPIAFVDQDASGNFTGSAWLNGNLAALTGQLVTEYEGTSIQFVPGGNISAIAGTTAFPNPANFIQDPARSPGEGNFSGLQAANGGSALAVFGSGVRFVTGGQQLGPIAFPSLNLDVISPVLPINGDAFDTIGTTVAIPSMGFAIDAANGSLNPPGLPGGLLGYTGVSKTFSQAAAQSIAPLPAVLPPGGVTLIGPGTWQLTLPFSIPTTFASGATGTVNGVLSGIIVATWTLPPPDGTTVSLTPATLAQSEGNSGTTPFVFTAGLSAASEQTITVAYATSNGTATAASGDYGATSGTLTFLPGETSKTITVLVNGDTTLEPDETFNVTLSSPVNVTFQTPADGQAAATILNDDLTPPALSISDVTAYEGNSGTTPFVFTINLSAVSGVQANVVYTTSNGTATSGSDYTAKTGTLIFAPGETSKTITVLVNGDTTFEPDETFNVTLSSPVNATLADNLGVGTILNSLPALSISSTYLATAVPFSFTDISGTGTVIGGLTNQDLANVAIPIGFTFPFFGTTNTTVFVSTKGLLTFGSGNNNYSNDDLTFTLSQAAIAPFWDDLHTGGGLAGSNVFYQVLGSGANQHLTVQWNQIRFYGSSAAGDTLTFQAELYVDGRIQFNYPDLVSGAAFGNNGASATVGIKDAGTQGPNRLLLAYNNGPNAFVGSGQSTLISSATSEGNAGTTPFVFTVSLSAISDLQTIVVYTTNDGTATSASGDYQPTSGTLTFAPGETSKLITVLVNGDTTFELDETFNVTLSSPVNATLPNNPGVGKILNDDSTPPALSISDVSSGEGTSGTTPFVFTVSLSAVSGVQTTVVYTTGDGTATSASGDYAATSGTLTFAPGETSKLITVLVNGDTAFELDEAFNVTLSAPVNATLADTLGVGTILNDDAPELSISDVINVTYLSTAVPFSFTDISGTGSLIAGLTDQDDASVAIPFGFTFPFFGAAYTTVFVSSNGLLTFGSDNTNYVNDDLTISPNQAAIAPFWDDLIVGFGMPGSNVFFQVLGSGSNQHLTVQWNHVQFITEGAASDTLTFQAELYADGRIQFNYPDLLSGIAAGNDGASATVGIKDVGIQGFNRLLLASNDGPNAFVGSGQSTLISPSSEGNAEETTDFVFNVNLSAVSGTLTTVVYTTSDGTATSASGDYWATSGTLTFLPGETSKTITVLVNGDTTFELDETFNVTLSSPVNATLADSLGVGTILNDDSPPALSISDVTYLATAVPYSFTDISGTGTIITGLTNLDDNSVVIPVGFTFPFFGTSNTTVFVSSNGLLTFGSGNAGWANDDLTTLVTQAAIAPFWDDLYTGGGLPGSNVFYQVFGSGANQHLTVQWNQIRFLSDNVPGDTLTFEAELYADGRIQFNYQDVVSGAAFGNNGASATVGIKDAGPQGPNRLLLAFNEGPNSLVGSGKSTLISPSSEGNAGTKNFAFTVSLSAVSGVQTTVVYTTGDGTATSASGDYQPTSGTLTFAPGETSKLITVLVNGDTTFELDETFNVTLSSPANATLDDSLGVGTIINDDPLSSTVVGRQLFYNGSGTSTRYDHNDLAINSFDDAAIATDKTAYLWEDAGAATFANVSSYTKGINGIMVDIAGSHPNITAADFIFRVGNNNSPGLWTTANAPTSVSVRAGAGVSGSDRVEIIWNGAAAPFGKWLEVITLANANTGLAQKAGYPAGQGDAFFFGNAPGNTGTGDTGSNSLVNSLDEAAIRANNALVSANIPITNVYDVGRNASVNVIDESAARLNGTNPSTTLKYLNLTTSPAAPEADGVTVDEVGAGDVSPLVATSDSGDSGVASALTAPGNLAPSVPGVPSWIATRLASADVNSSPSARLFQHLHDVNTPGTRALLQKFDAVADALGLDDELLDSLLADLG